MSSVTIYKNSECFEYNFISGDNLLELLRRHGYSVSAPCGGHGLCGKCRVLIKLGDKTETVMACKTRLFEDCEVFLPSDSGDISWNAVKGELAAEGDREGFGAAVDLGTTTVAVSLYELHSGKELNSASQWNVQKSCGADVISRIGYCMDNAEGLKRQCGAIREQILSMLKTLCGENGITLADVKEGFVAGNTVMEHIFAGISPDSIASAPYTPQACFSNGEAVPLEGIPFYLSPCVAGYVGGDITAGVLTAGLHESDKTALFIDVGTNGEIVLGNKNRLTSCAVASGPAFEGAGISCGMPAAKGAISRAYITDGGLDFDVIGGGEAAGICGSGLLDLAACLLELGYIDESGCLYTDDGGATLFLTESVYITQRDVRQLQLAKAAVSAGIARLLETEKLSCADIDVLYLSGGFGTRLNPESAVKIGMLPAELIGKAVPLGNTSLTGAAQALLDPKKRQELIKIKESCEYLELSSDTEFNERFVDAMGFPEQ